MIAKIPVLWNKVLNAYVEKYGNCIIWNKKKRVITFNNNFAKRKNEFKQVFFLTIVLISLTLLKITSFCVQVKHITGFCLSNEVIDNEPQKTKRKTPNQMAKTYRAFILEIGMTDVYLGVHSINIKKFVL